MLFVGALPCVVVCQVSLVRAFMRVCLPYITTRLDEELSLQQVRDLHPLGRLLLVPPELKALSLVLASAPTVSAGTFIGSEGDSCSTSFAFVFVCFVCVRAVCYRIEEISTVLTPSLHVVGQADEQTVQTCEQNSTHVQHQQTAKRTTVLFLPGSLPTAHWIKK